MKILELKLKKDVLIIDENDFGYYTNIDNEINFHLGNVHLRRVKGNFKLLCKGSELTEEIASELVDETIMYEKHKVKCYRYRSYIEGFVGFYNALESFISGVESKKFHWLENPCGRSRPCFNDYSSLIQYNGDVKEWQEAEEKTFKNPLIFVKK